MKDLSSSIESLTKRTDGLIHAYQQGVERIQSLEEDKRKLEGKMGGLNEEILRLKEENKVLRMASAIKGDEENVSESKRRISQLVREIDRCIALLND
ncbi:MAG: hypothetical protein RLP15_03175 [Cryomorphaceae bacterium]